MPYPDKILYKVTRPARYTGGEWNCVVKDWEKTALRFALAYPDAYEVGPGERGQARQDRGRLGEEWFVVRHSPVHPTDHYAVRGRLRVVRGTGWKDRSRCGLCTQYADGGRRSDPG